MAVHMNFSSRTLHRLVFAIALPLLAATSSASLATVRKVKAHVPAPRPPAVNNSIIALPLAPIVPAGQRLCTARTPAGLGYTILRAGSGPRPGADATVLVNYIGYLAASGAMFDQGMQSPLPVAGVIPGFAQGLQIMNRSGVVRLCIPAAMGYGPQASGPIPANSDLVFQVELLDFKTSAEIEGLRKAQSGEPSAQKDAVPQP